MQQKLRRHLLKPKEAKLVINKAAEKLKINFDTISNSKTKIESAETDFGQLIIINNKPLFFKSGETVLPTLFLDEIQQMPKIVVDMGAVPYICKGADVMAPGIRRIEGEFEKGNLVVIVDENHGKAIAIGESLYNSQTTQTTKKGAVIKTLHFVSDKVWNAAKLLNS